jgi:hypothetical protein
MPEETRLALRPSYLVGSPRSWALDSAMLLAALPWMAAVALMVDAVTTFGVGVLYLFLEQVAGGVLLLSLLAAAGGAMVGAVAPRVLEGLRGRVPLPLLALLYGTVASTVMYGAGLAATALAPAYLPMFMTPFVLAVTGLTATLVWLPYTMARVLQGPRGLVLVGASALALPLSVTLHLLLLWAL